MTSTKKSSCKRGLECLLVAGDGIEPSTFRLWAWRATTALPRDMWEHCMQLLFLSIKATSRINKSFIPESYSRSGFQIFFKICCPCLCFKNSVPNNFPWSSIFCWIHLVAIMFKQSFRGFTSRKTWIIFSKSIANYIRIIHINVTFYFNPSSPRLRRTFFAMVIVHISLLKSFGWFTIRSLHSKRRMVPMGGVEPPTTGLWVLCSTAELHWHESYESCSAIGGYIGTGESLINFTGLTSL